MIIFFFFLNNFEMIFPRSTGRKQLFRSRSRPFFLRGRLEERAKKRATLEICRVHDEQDECSTSVDYAMEKELEKVEYKCRS